MKRVLPYEIWSEIFQYTNKRQCTAFGMDYEWGKIHREYLSNSELYNWSFANGDLLKLEFMKNAATLIEKNNSVTKRIQLKKDIKEMAPPEDQMDRINYNRVYNKCITIKTGCDECKQMGKLIRCTVCYRESHAECIDYIECAGCERIHCKWCYNTCVDCGGNYCCEMLNLNRNSQTYEVVCTLCGMKCGKCGKNYCYKDSAECSICKGMTCGCRECVDCSATLCELSKDCRVCEKPLCDDCDTGLLGEDGLCEMCELLTWDCEVCGILNTTAVCSGCFDTSLSPD
jgi:hypothetical protein